MKKNIKSFIWMGIGISLLLAVFFSPFASASPDGLERVAEDKGFLEHAEADGVTVWEHSPIPDYAMPGVKNEGVATGLAGLIGVLGTFFFSYGFAAVLRKKDADQA